MGALVYPAGPGWWHQKPIYIGSWIWILVDRALMFGMWNIKEDHSIAVHMQVGKSLKHQPRRWLYNYLITYLGYCSLQDWG